MFSCAKLYHTCDTFETCSPILQFRRSAIYSGNENRVFQSRQVSNYHQSQHDVEFCPHCVPHSAPTRLLDSPAVRPPSTVNSPPVIKLASSEARNFAILTTSAGRPIRPSAVIPPKNLASGLSSSSIIMPVPAMVEKVSMPELISMIQPLSPGQYQVAIFHDGFLYIQCARLSQNF